MGDTSFVDLGSPCPHRPQGSVVTEGATRLARLREWFRGEVKADKQAGFCHGRGSDTGQHPTHALEFSSTVADKHIGSTHAFPLEDDLRITPKIMFRRASLT